MLHFAVIGSPIAHSRSPEIYGELFSKHGIDAEFTRLLIEPCELSHIRSLSDGLSGFAVTMPHKRAIIPYLDRLASTAEECGAVNIVERRGDELIGHNTDGDGLSDAITESGTQIGGASVLILGRGGAARSAAFALRRRGAQIRFLVRSLSGTGDFPELPFSPKDHSSLPHADVFINATPLGMQGAGEFEDFGFLDAIAPGFVFDMVYRRDRETNLLREAGERGIKALGGNAMLEKQALRAFEIWFGFKP